MRLLVAFYFAICLVFVVVFVALFQQLMIRTLSFVLSFSVESMCFLFLLRSMYFGRKVDRCRISARVGQYKGVAVCVRAI